MLAVNQIDFAAGEQGDQPERAVRKNLMLAAQLEAGGATFPVRIRNLSATGAMVDGQDLPAAGVHLCLARLGVSADAEVIWAEGNRAGVRFAQPVDIDEWVAGAYRSCRGTFAQARVDQVQQALRSGAVSVVQALPTMAAPAASSAIYARQTNELIAQELMLVKHMLDSISAELSENIEILMKHERALQNCDIAAAILEQVSKVVNAEDRAAAIGRVNMHEVKARLSGRPTLT